VKPSCEFYLDQIRRPSSWRYRKALLPRGGGRRKTLVTGRTSSAPGSYPRPLTYMHCSGAKQVSCAGFVGGPVRRLPPSLATLQTASPALCVTTGAQCGERCGANETLRGTGRRFCSRPNISWGYLNRNTSSYSWVFASCCVCEIR
jgi:hypothetical protein